jgi:GTPase SAR1 family protein
LDGVINCGTVILKGKIDLLNSRMSPSMQSVTRQDIISYQRSTKSAAPEPRIDISLRVQELHGLKQQLVSENGSERADDIRRILASPDTLARAVTLQVIREIGDDEAGFEIVRSYLQNRSRKGDPVIIVMDNELETATQNSTLTDLKSRSSFNPNDVRIVLQIFVGVNERGEPIDDMTSVVSDFSEVQSEQDGYRFSVGKVNWNPDRIELKIPTRAEYSEKFRTGSLKLGRAGKWEGTFARTWASKGEEHIRALFY